MLHFTALAFSKRTPRVCSCTLSGSTTSFHSILPNITPDLSLNDCLPTTSGFSPHLPLLSYHGLTARSSFQHPFPSISLNQTQDSGRNESTMKLAGRERSPRGNGPFNFLGFPPEVREVIYSYLYTDEWKQLKPPSTLSELAEPSFPHLLCSLHLICNLIHLEMDGFVQRQKKIPLRLASHVSSHR